MKKKLRKYKCKYCHKSVTRNSAKRWIKSYCQKVGRMVHVYCKQQNKEVNK